MLFPCHQSLGQPCRRSAGSVARCSSIHTPKRPGKALHSIASSGGGSGGPSGGSSGGGGSGGGGGDASSGGGPGGGGWRKLAGGAAVAFAAAAAAVGAADAWLGSHLEPQDTSGWRVSIVVPVLNEAKGIEATVAALRALRPAPCEIIVVDGGSTDGTRRLARRAGARVIASPRRGRAAQMNAGAAAAGGDVIAFVHADTRPPPDLVSVLRAAFRDPKTVLAGFRTSIEDPGRKLRLLSLHNTLKTWWAPLLFRPFSFVRGMRCLFGDQTLCCRASDFKRVGGYDESWRIMEDAQLCLDLHELGPPWPPAAAGHSGSSGGGGGGKKGGRRRRAGALEPGPASGCSGDGRGPLPPLPPLFPGRPRGRVLFVTDRLASTSGRRLGAWGPWRATAVHLAISLSWYILRDPQRVEALYERIYTDLYR